MRSFAQLMPTFACLVVSSLLLMVTGLRSVAQEPPRPTLQLNAPDDSSLKVRRSPFGTHPDSRRRDPVTLQRFPKTFDDPLIETSRDRSWPLEVTQRSSELPNVDREVSHSLTMPGATTTTPDQAKRYPLQELLKGRSLRPTSHPAISPDPTGADGHEVDRPFESLAKSLENQVNDWWKPWVHDSVLGEARWLRFDIATIVSDTLRHSPDILAVGFESEVAYTDIIQQNAAFDARLILDSKYRGTSDPVGNSLQTGGPPRLRESDWTSHLGVRRTNRLGGQLDVAQQLGTFNSNSVFLNPTSQGSTRLVVSLNQPLLAGAGRLFNERLVLRAQFNADATWSETRGEIQVRLAEVMSAYWQLYLERSRYVMQRDLLSRGQHIERLVVERSDFDTGKIEILRVQEQIARRRDRLIRVETDLKNQQSQLARLVGAPQLVQSTRDEFIPEDHPVCPIAEIDLERAVITGLHHRPDVAVATTELEAAALEVQVTRNQLLPQLNALLETYVAGLNGNYDVGQSFADQFQAGQPGVTAGLEFELPVGRRAAKAKHQAANLQLQRHSQKLRQAILTARAEIEVAVREIELAKSSLTVRQQTLDAAAAEESYLFRRFEMLGGDGSSVGLVLQDLLDAQQRRTDAEVALVSARIDYLKALISLEAAMGTLLMDQTWPQTQQLPTSIDPIQAIPSNLDTKTSES